MTYRLNKNFLLALVFFVSLLVSSWLLMSTTQKLSAQQSGPNQSQCIASGGTWNSQIDGGICFCDDGYNSTNTACAESGEVTYTWADVATYLCRNELGGERSRCVNGILNSGVTASQIDQFCLAVGGGQRSGDYYLCQSGMTESNQQSDEGREFNNDAATPPTSPGTPVEAGGCDDGEDCPDDAEPLPTEQVCDGNEFCERDIEECDASDTSGRCLANLSIMRRIIVILNVMTIIIVPLITLVIIVGGVQYSMATGDPSKVNDAKKRITNAIIALVSYAFLWSFLQWLVPGGVF